MPAVEHPLGEGSLLQAFLELDTPLGSKAEFIEGEIVVTPLPDGQHEGAASKLAKQFGKPIDLPPPFSFALDTAPLR
ncbi:hypothetical protein [Kitasatospora sp. NPDC008115]|uniref:hypothetical protein n=1 Tax=Kitasatospora sp. NPDC008115 TaxID=3364022 RepID=UPI0036EEA4D9